MAFRVEVEPQAFEDLDAIVEHIKAHGSFETAERWFRSVMRSIGSLEDMPARCPIAEESEELGHDALFAARNGRIEPTKCTLRFSATLRQARRCESFIWRHWARRASRMDSWGARYID